MNGQEWYDHIMEDNPVFLKKFNGTDICIHPDSRRYVIGDGVPAHRRLMESIEKLGLQRGEIFSRRIGALERVPGLRISGHD